MARVNWSTDRQTGTGRGPGTPAVCHPPIESAWRIPRAGGYFFVYPSGSEKTPSAIGSVERAVTVVAIVMLPTCAIAAAA